MKTATLLLVDDRSDSLFVLHEQIATFLPGCRIVQATDGEQALEIALSERLDGALIDVQMADMDGIELCRRLKADPRTESVPVLLVTSCANDPDLRVRGLEAGAEDFVSRLVDTEELAARVRVLLRGKEAGDQLRDAKVLLEGLLTERTRELDTSESRFRALFEQLPVGTLVAPLDAADGKLRPPFETNPALREILGLADGQPLAGPLSRFVVPEEVEAAQARFVAFISGGASFDLDMTARRDEGQGDVRVHVTLAQVRDSQGQPTHILAAVRDRTEGHKLERSLARSDRLASVGLLAAGMAHEVNNPLTWVLHNVATIQRDLPLLLGWLERCRDLQTVRGEPTEGSSDGCAGGLTPERLAILEAAPAQAADGLARIREIVGALGSFSRVEDATDRVDISRAIEAAARMSQPRFRHSATIELDLQPMPLVEANEGQLSQVFLNLIVNAGQALGEGSPSDNRVWVTCYAEGDEVAAEVRDNGPGIPAQDVRRLFDPFFTTKPVGIGTGLGLSICHNIVEGLGGRLEVDSQVGVGSTFRVVLPRAEGPAAQPSEPPPAAPSRRSARGKILVVDDEPMLLRGVQDILADEHEVRSAGSGAEALSLLEEGAHVDLILLDLMMPDVDGVAVHDWIEANRPELLPAVVLMSGGAYSRRASELLAKTQADRLDKPFWPDELLKLVARRLRSQPR